MKRYFSIILSVVMTVSMLFGCGSKTSNTEKEPNKQATAEVVNNSSESGKKEEKAEPLDLTGLWVQENPNDSYMVATIQEDGKMGVFFILENDDEPWTYWVGTYVKPTEATDTYSWTSENTYGGSGLLASEDDNKDFHYKNEKITYSVTFQGETKDVSLVRGEWDTSKIPDSAFSSVKVSTSDVKELEIKDSGWYVENGKWLHYYVSFYNPNEDIIVELPSYRITARDANGALIGTDDHTLSEIYPKQTFVYGSQAFSVDEIPASVDFEVLEAKEYNLKNASTVDEYIPLEVVNTAVRSGTIVGEIINDNKSDIDEAIVVAICRNSEGEFIDVVSTFVDDVKTGVTTPFSMYENIDGDVQSIEYYANVW